jgi:hypothetical protein
MSGAATRNHGDMADAERTPGEQRRLRTGRLEAFSDGVFAIAITVLLLVPFSLLRRRSRT